MTWFQFEFTGRLDAFAVFPFRGDLLPQTGQVTFHSKAMQSFA